MRAVAPHRAFYMRARVGEDAPQAFRMRAIAAAPRVLHARTRGRGCAASVPHACDRCRTRVPHARTRGDDAPQGFPMRACAATLPTRAFRMSGRSARVARCAAAIADALRLRSAWAAELVFARTLRRAALEVERGLVVAGLDGDLGDQRPGALLAPRLDLVLAGLEAAEREAAVLLGDDVVGSVDDDQVRGHVRVDVAAEPDDARLVELDLAHVAALVEPEVEALRLREREHVVVDRVEVRERDGRADGDRHQVRRERLVALFDDAELLRTLGDLAALGPHHHEAHAGERLALELQRAVQHAGLAFLGRRVIVRLADAGRRLRRGVLHRFERGG